MDRLDHIGNARAMIQSLAMSGIMLTMGEANRPPVRIVPSTVDYGTGFIGAYGIALALLDRQRSGKGQKIDASLLDTAVFYMNTQIANYSLTGRLPYRMGSASLWGAPYQVFETKDRPVFIGVINDKAWKRFHEALGLQNLAVDPHFATLDDRLRNRDELAKRLNSVFKQHTSEEILDKLVGADIPCSLLLNVDEVISHPRVIAREMIADVECPGIGKAKIPRTPIRLGNSNTKDKFDIPPLGKHTNEILRELGYTQAEISDLGEAGIVLQYVDQS